MKRVRSTSLKSLRHVDSMVLIFGGKKYVYSIQKELRLSRDKGIDLYQAERFAFWKRVLAEKRRELREIEQEYQEQRDWMQVQIPDILRKDGRKDTEAAVQAEVRLQTPVQKLKKRVDDALYQVDLAQMMCDAFEHRRSVLMKLRTQKGDQ